tara:strand:- start:1447 stop:1827 length:381 start_codon:yes stop_codon:yes gene_type:complete
MNKLSKSDIEAMTYTQCVNEITKASKYINELIDSLPSKIKDFVYEENWEEVKGVPKERKPIQFRNTDGDWLEGVYIEAEQMFYLGYEESGEFLFHCDVTDWEYISEKDMSQEGKEYIEKVSYHHFK